MLELVQGDITQQTVDAIVNATNSRIIGGGGGNLPAKYIIHTVGAIWRGGNEKEILQQCYQISLLLAKQYQVSSIAFPSISTGAYGFPSEAAAPIAVKAVNNFLVGQNCKIKVRFVLFDSLTLSHYQNAVASLQDS